MCENSFHFNRALPGWAGAGGSSEKPVGDNCSPAPIPTDRPFKLLDASTLPPHSHPAAGPGLHPAPPPSSANALALTLATSCCSDPESAGPSSALKQADGSAQMPQFPTLCSRSCALRHPVLSPAALCERGECQQPRILSLLLCPGPWRSPFPERAFGSLPKEKV